MQDGAQFSVCQRATLDARTRLDMAAARAITGPILNTGAMMNWRAVHGTPQVLAGVAAGTLLLGGIAAAPAIGAEGFIYVSDWQAASFGAIGGDLRSRLAAQFTYDLGRADSDVEIMRMVRSDPRSVGF